MTLSVGLGKIITDPQATILTRKALSILSKPELLVTDRGVTIDNDGRIVLKFKTDGGITEDADGLSLEAPFGPGVAAGTGVWNIYMTGTAANHFAGTVAIGTTTLTAKLSVLSTTEQLRLLYDASNYVKMTVSSVGVVTIQSVGTSGGFDFVTPSTKGVKINSGSAITRVLTTTATFTLSMLAASSDYTITVTGAVVGDTVCVSPTNASPTTLAAGWSASVTATNTVTVRVSSPGYDGSSPSLTFRVVVIGYT